MEDEAKTKAPDIKRIYEKVTVEEEAAFEIYMGLKERTLPKLHDYLIKQGHKISLGTIKRWARRGRWVALGNNPDHVDMNRVRSMIDLLKTEAALINHDVYTGLQGRLLVRLSEAIALVKIEHPSEVIEMIKAATDIRGLVHDAKGIDIKSGGGLGVPGNVTSLGTFKKPTGA